MDYIIENEYLKVTVTTNGAQLKSVIRKCDGVEHVWQADPEVWGFHAPILFPHAGKVVDGIIEAKGGKFESKQHGFVRLMEHEFVEQTRDSIVLELRSSEETLKIFPYEFALFSTFTLENDTYLATTALAFPEDVAFRTIELLPPATSFEVYAGGYRASVHPVRVNHIAPITPDIWHKAYLRIEELLQNRQDTPLRVGAVIKACDDLWPAGMLHQGPPLVYEIIRALKKEGRLGVAFVPVPGAFEGYTTNNFNIYLK